MPAQPMARPNRTVAPHSVMTSLVRLVRNAWSRYSPRVGVSPRRLGAVPAGPRTLAQARLELVLALAAGVRDGAGA